MTFLINAKTCHYLLSNKDYENNAHNNRRGYLSDIVCNFKTFEPIIFHKDKFYNFKDYYKSL